MNLIETIILLILGLAVVAFFASTSGPREKREKSLGAPLVAQWKARFEDQVQYFKNNPL